MGILIVLILFLFVVIFIFSSKKISPIPYFPTQQADLSKIIEALKLKNNQTVIDLGAGDGIVIFKAAGQAKKQGLTTKFVAVEINPVLIFVLHFRRFFSPNRKNIKIVWEDMFKSDGLRPRSFDFAQDDIVVYLYISPWFLEKVISRFSIRNSKLKIVSYMYPVPSLKKKQKIIRGKNSIFIYDL